MTGFRAQLAEQRWDDHRYYHHSLVNQSLHFVSACTFTTVKGMHTELKGNYTQKSLLHFSQTSNVVL